MKFLLVLLLVACGYQSGDLDRALECVDGCEKMPEPKQITCTTQAVSNGAIILCPDGSSSLIINGSNGVDGERGMPGDRGEVGLPGVAEAPQQYGFVDVIDPCGDGPGFDEVLFRTHTGELVALFYSPPHSFLTFIGPGSYQTTDQQACSFSVEFDGSVSY